MAKVASLPSSDPASTKPEGLRQAEKAAEALPCATGSLLASPHDTADNSDDYKTRLACFGARHRLHRCGTHHMHCKREAVHTHSRRQELWRGVSQPSYATYQYRDYTIS